ncbi:MAG: GTP 3',8-cyclase MoaA [Candidatus Kapaibacterium sp.]
MLIDSFNRVHDYLRISLTDTCNLRCTYCDPADFEEHHFSRTRMTAEEIDTIAGLFVQQGIKKIRITGGEPLIRKDAKEILRRLAKYPVTLALTTNGVFVHEHIDTFKEVGLRSVNVSLDSLKKETFLAIAKRNEFERVYDNIRLLLKEDFHVKVNMVVMNGVNTNEICDFIEWTKDAPVHIRFIEFMPFPGNRWDEEKVFSYVQILGAIAERYSFEKLPDDKNDTAKKYHVPGHRGTFAVISTMTEPFCSTCNRLRLTTDGKMRNCLFSKTETDLLTPLRNGMDILPLIKQCVQDKFEMLGGNTTQYWAIEETTSHRRSMMGIGG